MLNFMKTAIVTGLLAVGGGTVAAVSGVDVVPDQVQSIVFQQQDGTENPDRPSDEERTAVREFVKGEIAPVMAELLGVSVEELEAARENDTMSDLVEAAGLTREEVKAALSEAKANALNAAVDEGLLTAEQAEQIQSREGRKGRRGGGGNRLGGIIDRAEVQQTLAGILGISVEELEAAREDGTKLPELIEELGLDAEEVKAEMQAAREAAIQQAVEDGTITQEQADELLSGEGRGGRGHGGQGGRGQGGEGAPQGISNDNLDA